MQKKLGPIHNILNIAHVLHSISSLVNTPRFASCSRPGGGYKLAKNAGNIFLIQITNALDQSLKITRCEEGSANGCTKKGIRCQTHDLWYCNHILKIFTYQLYSLFNSDIILYLLQHTNKLFALQPHTTTYFACCIDTLLCIAF